MKCSTRPHTLGNRVSKSLISHSLYYVITLPSVYRLYLAQLPFVGASLFITSIPFRLVPGFRFLRSRPLLFLQFLVLLSCSFPLRYLFFSCFPPLNWVFFISLPLGKMYFGLSVSSAVCTLWRILYIPFPPPVQRTMGGIGSRIF